VSVGELKEKLAQVETDALEELARAESTQRLEELRLEFLGQKGVLTLVLRGLGQLNKEERPQVGELANKIKERISAGLSARKDELYRKELGQRLAGESIDVTLP